MGIENSAGLGVKNVYGPRETAEGRAGEIRTAGATKQIQLDFRGDNYDQVSFSLPKGALLTLATAVIEEAFVLGGTSPTINIGVAGSAGTNYLIEIDETSAETVDTVVGSVSGVGSLSGIFASDFNLTVELDGTSPTIGAEGKAKVIIEYFVSGDV